MNREEREEHVILLYKDGRTFKDIAKEMQTEYFWIHITSDIASDL